MLTFLVLLLQWTCVLAQSGLYFRIFCMDATTGEGVPLVLLRTGNYLEFYSDSAGNIAFFEPGLMDQPVFFSVLADGYKFLSGGQQYPPPYDSGIVLQTTSGGTATVAVTRMQHAHRMYRLTGAGLYRDTMLVGADVPASVRARAVAEPSTGSFGQDTVMVAAYKGKVFWTWGDTVCPRSARQNNCDQTGMYSVGATSCLPATDPQHCSAAAPPNLQYFAQESPLGFHHPQPLAPIPPLDQNTWLSALVVINANTTDEALYAYFFKNPGDGAGPGTALQGMARWNDTTQQFVPVSYWPMNTTLSLDHTVQVLSPADANSGFVYFAHNGVNARVPASAAALASYAAFEMLSWPTPAEWGSGSVNWNAWAERYVYVGAGDGDAMYVGFSQTLQGPWEYATIVASHNTSGSSCYNPVHLPHMDLEQGRVISFACTYTAMWSNPL